jgi:tRNA(Ile)-lysidine synthase
VATEFLKSLKTSSHVLVAYSGGSDSTGLLVALAKARSTLADTGIRLSAATVDHGLRAESAAEAHAAGVACGGYGVPHAVLRWQAEKPQTGLQAAARAARYQLLDNHARAIGATLVVTGHTLDDQIETYAMRLARSPEPPGGMSGAVLHDRHTWFLRPFLGVRRAEIRAWLAGQAIGWIDDPSNDNPAFERVRVRGMLSAHAPHADFVALSALRRRLAVEAAQFLGANATVVPLCAAVVDLSRLEPGNAAHMQALLHLLAMMGGRSHPGGRDTLARLGKFLASPDDRRLTVERVLAERRGRRLWMTRERRGIPEIEIAGGHTAVWDGRLRIVNRGAASVRIGVGAGGRPLVAGALPEDLPKSLALAIAATRPLVAPAQADVQVTPVIAQFDQFLPVELIDIANKLALLSGIDQFPELPTKQ